MTPFVALNDLENLYLLILYKSRMADIDRIVFIFE